MKTTFLGLLAQVHERLYEACIFRRKRSKFSKHSIVLCCCLSSIRELSGMNCVVLPQWIVLGPWGCLRGHFLSSAVCECVHHLYEWWMNCGFRTDRIVRYLGERQCKPQCGCLVTQKRVFFWSPPLVCQSLVQITIARYSKAIRPLTGSTYQ